MSRYQLACLARQVRYNEPTCLVRKGFEIRWTLTLIIIHNNDLALKEGCKDLFRLWIIPGVILVRAGPVESVTVTDPLPWRPISRVA
jgi:hypothetical protein